MRESTRDSNPTMHIESKRVLPLQSPHKNPKSKILQSNVILSLLKSLIISKPYFTPLLFLLLYCPAFISTSFLKGDRYVLNGFDQGNYEAGIKLGFAQKQTPESLIDIKGVKITQPFSVTKEYDLISNEASPLRLTRIYPFIFKDNYVSKFFGNSVSEQKVIEIHQFEKGAFQESKILKTLSFTSNSQTVQEVVDIWNTDLIAILLKQEDDYIVQFYSLNDLNSIMAQTIFKPLLGSNISSKTSLSIVCSSTMTCKGFLYPKSSPKTVPKIGHKISLFDLVLTISATTKKVIKLEIKNVSENREIFGIFENQTTNPSADYTATTNALKSLKTEIIRIGQYRNQFVMALYWQPADQAAAKVYQFSQIGAEIVTVASLPNTLRNCIKVDMTTQKLKSVEVTKLPETSFLDVSYSKNDLISSFYLEDIQKPIESDSFNSDPINCKNLPGEPNYFPLSFRSYLRTCIEGEDPSKPSNKKLREKYEYGRYDPKIHSFTEVVISNVLNKLVYYQETSTKKYAGFFFMNQINTKRLQKARLFGQTSEEADSAIYLPMQTALLFQKANKVKVATYSFHSLLVDTNIAEETNSTFLILKYPFYQNNGKNADKMEINFELQSQQKLDFNPLKRQYLIGINYPGLRAETTYKLDLTTPVFLPDNGEIIIPKIENFPDLKILDGNVQKGEIEFEGFDFNDKSNMGGFVRYLSGNLMVFFKGDQNNSNIQKLVFLKCDEKSKTDLKCKVQFEYDGLLIKIDQKKTEIQRFGNFLAIIAPHKTDSSLIVIDIISLKTGVRPTSLLHPALIKRGLGQKSGITFRKTSVDLRGYYIDYNGKLVKILISNPDAPSSGSNDGNKFVKIEEIQLVADTANNGKFCPTVVSIKQNKFKTILIASECDPSPPSSTTSGKINSLREFDISENPAFEKRFNFPLTLSTGDSTVASICSFQNSNFVGYDKPIPGGDVGTTLLFASNDNLRYQTTTIQNTGVEKILETGCLDQGFGAFARVLTKQGDHKLFIIRIHGAKQYSMGNRLLKVFDLEKGLHLSTSLSMRVLKKELIIVIRYDTTSGSKISFIRFNLIKNSYFFTTPKKIQNLNYNYQVGSIEKAVSGVIGVTIPQSYYLKSLKSKNKKIESFGDSNGINLEDYFEITGPYYGSNLLSNNTKGISIRDRVYPLKSEVKETDTRLFADFVESLNGYELAYDYHKKVRLVHSESKKVMVTLEDSSIISAKFMRNLDIETTVSVVVLTQNSEGTTLHLLRVNNSDYGSPAALPTHTTTFRAFYHDSVGFVHQSVTRFGDKSHPEDRYHLICALEGSDSGLIIDMIFEVKTFKILELKRQLTLPNYQYLQGIFFTETYVYRTYSGLLAKFDEKLKLDYKRKEQQFYRMTFNSHKTSLKVIGASKIYEGDIRNGKIDEQKASQIQEIPSNFQILSLLTSSNPQYEAYLALKIDPSLQNSDRYYILIYESKVNAYPHQIFEISFTEKYYETRSDLNRLMMPGLACITKENILILSNRINFIKGGKITQEKYWKISKNLVLISEPSVTPKNIDEGVKVVLVSPNEIGVQANFNLKTLKIEALAGIEVVNGDNKDDGSGTSGGNGGEGNNTDSSKIPCFNPPQKIQIQASQFGRSCSSSFLQLSLQLLPLFSTL